MGPHKYSYSAMRFREGSENVINVKLITCPDRVMICRLGQL